MHGVSLVYDECIVKMIFDLKDGDEFFASGHATLTKMYPGGVFPCKLVGLGFLAEPFAAEHTGLSEGNNDTPKFDGLSSSPQLNLNNFCRYNGITNFKSHHMCVLYWISCCLFHTWAPMGHPRQLHCPWLVCPGHVRWPVDDAVSFRCSFQS